MNAISELLSYLTAPTSGSPWAVGTVATVTAGAAADGNALVTVNWLGGNYAASYGAHYTPVVDDVVLMARTQPLSIVQRLVGTPPTT